jgi:hypothetical protein
LFFDLMYCFRTKSEKKESVLILLSTKVFLVKKARPNERKGSAKYGEYGHR